MSKYTEQAERFCKKYDVRVIAVLADYGPFFEDDKESRDIYRVTIRRGRKSFSLRFGQSIANTNKCVPSSYDILACITKSDPGTFENFCSDFGYESDSRKAEKVYRAVCREWRNVSRLFNKTELVELQEIA